MSEETKLTVKRIDKKDAGKNLIRLPKETVRRMGLKTKDILKLEGEKTTGAIFIGATSKRKEGIIEIDGLTRKNAGVSIGEKVKVAQTEAKEGDSVTLTPIGISTDVPGKIIKRMFMGQPVSKDDMISPEKTGSMSGNKQRGGQNLIPTESGPISAKNYKFKVENVKPEGIVKINRNTEINVKEKKEEALLQITKTYDDIGGLDEEIKKVRELIETPIRHPELFKSVGIKPPKGILLQGPPGCGKTLLAKAVANESDAYFKFISGPEIMSKFYGASEKKLRQIFQDARENQPAIIMIDELDSIGQNREETRDGVSRRVVSQLLGLMDGLNPRENVVVIAATNRVDSIDPALRRPGRFDREIKIGVPNKKDRKEILQIHTRSMPLAEDVDMEHLSKQSYGMTGADIEALSKEAAMNALREVLPRIDIEKERIPAEIMDNINVDSENFSNALKDIEPSAMREILAEVPDANWEDIGGLNKVKKELKRIVEWQINLPETNEGIKLDIPQAVLLYGAPGTGRTTLAKAVANESKANFISIKANEIFSKWVGESEQRIRDMFKKARQVAPSIIFLDEIDALTPTRGQTVGSQAYERVVSQLLTELDGLERLEDVIVIGATNRPDMLDPALLRPGRFDKVIWTPVPDKNEREEIFKVHTRELQLGKEVELKRLSRKTEDYTGADIEEVCKEASRNAFIRNKKAKKVKKEDFEQALKEIPASTSKEMEKNYQKFKEEHRRKSKKKKRAESYVM